MHSGGYGIVLAGALMAPRLLGVAVRKVVVVLNLVVMPGERRVHTTPLPTVGGAALFLAFLAAMAVASQLPDFRDVFDGSSAPLAVVIAATIIFAVGLGDDVREISAPAKLSGQVLAGSVLYLLGVSMFFFRFPFTGVLSLSPDLQPLVT